MKSFKYNNDAKSKSKDKSESKVKDKDKSTRKEKKDTSKPQKKLDNLKPVIPEDLPSGINIKPYLEEESNTCCKSNKIQTKDRKSFEIADNKTVLHIDIRDLPDAIISVLEDGRYTPLIIDGNKDRVDTYFQYSGGAMEALIIDAKGLMLKTQVHKSLTIDEGKENLRQSLVSSLRYGKAFLLCMGDCAFNPYKFDSTESFPVEKIFTSGGKEMMKSENYEKILRLPQDAHPHGIFVANEEFKVIVTTRFSLEDYVEFLDGAGFPISKCFPIYVMESKGQ